MTLKGRREMLLPQGRRKGVGVSGGVGCSDREEKEVRSKRERKRRISKKVS